ncbi:MAG: LytTR family DNA-binding domain-containing protein [Pseudomonadota bacterium]
MSAAANANAEANAADDAPIGAPDAVLGAAPDAVPDVVPDVVPGAAPDAIPDAAPHAAPGPTLGAAPVAAPTMPPLRALIVDDEEPGRVNLRYALAEYPRWRLAGECASVAAARALLAAEPVDLVLLDVQMPRENGLALARELCQLAEPPLLVFVTAFNAYAVEAFEVHALDYLLKPIDDLRLAQALARAEAMLAQRQRAAYGQAVRAFLAAQDAARPAAPGGAGQAAAPAADHWRQLNVRSVGRIECIQLDQVHWIGAAGNYVELHLAGRLVLHRVPIGRLERHLDPQHFLRVHRGAIVRVDQLRALAALGDGNYELSLHSGARVPVSERHVPALRQRMGDA